MRLVGVKKGNMKTQDTHHQRPSIVAMAAGNVDEISFVVRGLGGRMMEDFNDGIEWATRKLRYHHYWQSVFYKGKRYQLMGGVYTQYWIDLRCPIKGRL